MIRLLPVYITSICSKSAMNYGIKFFRQFFCGNNVEGFTFIRQRPTITKMCIVAVLIRSLINSDHITLKLIKKVS